jgi:hypothetical protein
MIHGSATGLRFLHMGTPLSERWITTSKISKPAFSKAVVAQ